MDKATIQALEIQKANEVAEGGSIERFLASYHIPEGKEDIICKHIGTIRARHPHFKSDRILRKAAEFFNLKKK